MAPIHVSKCNEACPLCCHFTTEEIYATHESKWKAQALTASNVVCFVMLISHIVFAWHGLTLVFPYYFYAIAASPYGITALDKVRRIGGRSKKCD